jgi:hypothetical protein
MVDQAPGATVETLDAGVAKRSAFSLAVLWGQGCPRRVSAAWRELIRRAVLTHGMWSRCLGISKSSFAEHLLVVS